MIVFWDHDGTIVESRNPNDSPQQLRKIMPGIKAAMQAEQKNIIISGFASPESESQDFDPVKIIGNFQSLMKRLPIDMAIFSPKRGGMECYVVIKNGKGFKVIEAHQNSKYKEYIGKFKKPEIGMLIVASDLLVEYLDLEALKDDMVMIGDTWHDQAAAQKFGIKFISADIVHQGDVTVKT